MKIDVALNPAEIARLHSRDLARTTCVVFDVLRATSSMITALAHGVGNSPFEYRELLGRTIITTTNGMLALWACENAGATPDALLCA